MRYQCRKPSWALYDFCNTREAFGSFFEVIVCLWIYGITTELTIGTQDCFERSLAQDSRSAHRVVLLTEAFGRVIAAGDTTTLRNDCVNTFAYPALPYLLRGDATTVITFRMAPRTVVMAVSLLGRCH